jgi:DNA-binding NarL/FixJ family response regulator
MSLDAPPLRVLVADDHPLFRDGITAALEAIGDVEVVGAAADGDEAVRLTAALEPDVVLMDLAMPGCNGVDATRQVLRHRPDTAVLILTMLDGDDSVLAAVRAGARGYLLKGADRAEIAAALQAVRSGQAVFGGGVAERVLTRLSTPTRAAGRSEAFPELTDREVEVLDLLAEGLSNHGIARRLVLSDKTVRNHVSNVLAKLSVADREAAAELARTRGRPSPAAEG